MFTKLGQRSSIKIEVIRCRSTQECIQGLREPCGDAALTNRTGARWVKRFEKAGMPFRTISVQDNTTRRGEQHSSTTCSLLVAAWAARQMN